MKIKVYVVDMEIPVRVKKWALGVGVPAAVVLGGGAVAWASGLVTWTSGQTLLAADLNNNFSYLQNQITGDGGVQGEIAALQGEITGDGGVQAQIAALQASVFPAGTYPAVVGGSESYETSIASFSCGAPTALAFDVNPTGGAETNVANAAFGHLIFTRSGAFDQSQGNSTVGAITVTPFASTSAPCANLCYGPVRFSLYRRRCRLSSSLDIWMTARPPSTLTVHLPPMELGPRLRTLRAHRT